MRGDKRDVIYENGVDRRVGVGVIVATHDVRRELKKEASN